MALVCAIVNVTCEGGLFGCDITGVKMLLRWRERLIEYVTYKETSCFQTGLWAERGPPIGDDGGNREVGEGGAGALGVVAPFRLESSRDALVPMTLRA